MANVIKTNSDYNEAIAEIEDLIDVNPMPDSPDAERLEFLSIIIHDYEDRHFRFELPDPIDAILFRMEHQNLTQSDLVPFIGSRSKVSEILSRKRTLTLSMIRSLHSNLNIPAKVLLQEGKPAELDGLEIEFDRFPIKEMVNRGWIEEKNIHNLDYPKKPLLNFFAKAGSPELITALYRKNDHIRSARPMDRNALLAWTIYIMTKAQNDPPNVGYKKGIVDLEFLKRIAQLSIYESGPLLAGEYLQKHGISLIIEPHLPRTHLDGAAIMTDKGQPVIGLTLRYDRIDNFWFCLMHELAHVSLHFDNDLTMFYDDLEVEDQDDLREKEADRLAGEALIPDSEWEKSPASRSRSAEAAESLAKKLGIHPAIVAGRMRHEFKSYRFLNRLIGHRLVRCHYSDKKWGK